MTESEDCFPLAPMDWRVRGLTLVLLLLPVAFLVHALLRPVALSLVLIYVGVWVYLRPSAFLVQDGKFVVRFPGRVRVSDVVLRCERVTRTQMRDRFGVQVRVGAGGLWGGFGWLWSRRGWVEFYVSRLDGWVLLERGEASPLLISPADPDALVAAMRSL